jgi:hypothetical protein
MEQQVDRAEAVTSVTSAAWCMTGCKLRRTARVNNIARIEGSPQRQQPQQLCTERAYRQGGLPVKAYQSIAKNAWYLVSKGASSPLPEGRTQQLLQ